MVASRDRDGFGFAGRLGEFEKVQRTVHRVQGKEMGAWCAAHVIANAVDAKWNVGIGNALQRTAAHLPVPCCRTRRGKCLDGLLPAHIWPQTANRPDFRGHQLNSSGNRSTTPPPSPAANK